MLSKLYEKLRFTDIVLVMLKIKLSTTMYFCLPHSNVGLMSEMEET